MKAKQLLTEFRDAAFIGEVASLRNTYAVFATESHFILVTFSGPLSGNFNLVQRRFGGRKNLTSGEILKRSSFTDRFDVLRVLYVLEAMKQATKKWAKPPGRGFVFAVKRSAGS